MPGNLENTSRAIRNEQHLITAPKSSFIWLSAFVWMCKECRCSNLFLATFYNCCPGSLDHPWTRQIRGIPAFEVNLCLIYVAWLFWKNDKKLLSIELFKHLLFWSHNLILSFSSGPPHSFFFFGCILLKYKFEGQTGILLKSMAKLQWEGGGV